jgi:hypothetical protein
MRADGVDAISRVRSVHLTRNPVRNVAFLFALASTGPRPGKVTGVCGARGVRRRSGNAFYKSRLVTNDNAWIPARLSKDNRLSRDKEYYSFYRFLISISDICSLSSTAINTAVAVKKTRITSLKQI